VSYEHNTKVLAVIPARFASTRFPQKMLAELQGKPLVFHAYQQATQAALVTDALVATDDERIALALKPFDVPVMMTRPDHPSGTDRIAEIAQNSDAEIIVNVQGDEPLIDPAIIDQTIEPLLRDSSLLMATARTPLTHIEDIQNPNIVKVICNQQGHALYFSRSPIPHIRDAQDRHQAMSVYWQHVGLYAYRRDFLLQFHKMAQTPLEKLERLEQLRALENGIKIAVVDTSYKSIGVDTPEDLERVRDLMSQREGRN